MNPNNNPLSTINFKKFRTPGVLFLAFLMLVMTGCISSTRVYQTDKTITYNGALYNMSNVQKIDSRIEGKLPNGEVVDMKNMNKKAVQTLLNESSPIVVTTFIDMDAQDLIYERRSITRYSEFSSMRSKFEKAGQRVTKFMANKKSTQLKLK